MRSYFHAIEDFGQQSGEFLGIFDGDLKRIHTFNPFGGRGVRAVRIAGPRIHAISHGRGSAQDGTPIARFDAVLEGLRDTLAADHPWDRAARNALPNPRLADLLLLWAVLLARRLPAGKTAPYRGYHG
ncbi:hypothetical protein M8756_11700 [Lutimaribacter sp. EGI FJ00015]|uniref:Uncharacterized protein n=1 Tax=Lutimaribacter degradans TaxID=2945989 RepID=A0ACC5ZZN2_9RHOB|nr:hypothetical protein [Lutimaribacter sp. EGI FJ00013]MCM2562814.1 hypothetical protein [Lutimaribacter sp. EGI FJ00013]MCO0613971.1 hypothetical protein [Lutimaribacter sp. EGI FJ00015]MCO0636943.1 hypothetical protein [Lutimaribacter sp. EGI FJ00014]